MAVIDFDAAVAVLRRVHLDGEALPPIAHASGRPTARMTTDLLDFLRAVERSLIIAARSENRVFSMGARGRVDDHLELDPGCVLVRRPDRRPAPAATAAPFVPQTIVTDAQGLIIDPGELRPGDELVPRGGRS